jgi:CheY-like chemotaxis protein
MIGLINRLAVGIFYFYRRGLICPTANQNEFNDRREIAIELEAVLPRRFLENFMQNEGNVSGSTYFNMSELPSISPSPEGQLAGTERVLIFSLENDTRFLLKTLLEIWGYNTAEADSLENSLAIVENLKPDLILLDSMLPFERHLENIRQIRRNKFSKEIPIIVLSGFSQPQFEKLSIAVGADGFLVKPLDFDLLEGFLKKNIEKKGRKLH